MKNSEDEDDLFGAKRPRGRPRTGAAKSGAERQRSYRKQSRARDRVSLSVMISVEARVSLDALARHHGCSLAEVLEPLLIAEKDKIVAQIYATGTPEEQEAASARFLCISYVIHCLVCQVRPRSTPRARRRNRKRHQCGFLS